MTQDSLFPRTSEAELAELQRQTAVIEEKKAAKARARQEKQSVKDRERARKIRSQKITMLILLGTILVAWLLSVASKVLRW